MPVTTPQTESAHWSSGFPNSVKGAHINQAGGTPEVKPGMWRGPSAGRKSHTRLLKTKGRLQSPTQGGGDAAGTGCRKRGRVPTSQRLLQLDLLNSCCRELESIDPATLRQSPWEIASGGDESSLTKGSETPLFPPSPGFHGSQTNR